jgi:hypothetical protein
MRSFLVTDAVRDYAAAHSSWRPDPVVRELQERTRALGAPAGMQIGDDQGQLLTMLTHLVGARMAVEVGTFTGYSSLCIARGLAEGGTLVCCDISEEWTAIGQEAWRAAGVADRIDLRIAPALDTLRSLPTDLAVDLVGGPSRPPVAPAARLDARCAVQRQSALMRAGFFSRPARPFQARLTRWAATSAFFILRESSHHWPVSATMPTSIWA